MNRDDDDRDDPTFWRRSSIERLLATGARRAAWGMGPTDAMSRVWLVLTSRFPTGDAPGDAPDPFLGETIRFEARNYFARKNLDSPRASPG